eukprot:TRINITY_DN1692_c0_g1_i6.p1 TRINITY_DN1692_c0_g1~~TRINITY_DN1692_c0_g1_i6.p1  ORF type:complete len:150 (+),score=29.14 TRINITY_DN1692_c0_g1_i6:118-567(+)
MDKVMEGLFISDLIAATNETELAKHGITHIVNASGMSLMTKGRECYNIYVMDSPGANIYKFFEPAVKFIEKARAAGKNVLVNCAAGISRSSSLVLAYMMFKEKEGLNECLTKLKKCRSVVWPNPGFYGQLQKFETMLGLKSKVSKPSLY